MKTVWWVVLLIALIVAGLFVLQQHLLLPSMPPAKEKPFSLPEQKQPNSPSSVIDQPPVNLQPPAVSAPEDTAGAGESLDQ